MLIRTMSYGHTRRPQYRAVILILANAPSPDDPYPHTIVQVFGYKDEQRRLASC